MKRSSRIFVASIAVCLVLPASAPTFADILQAEPEAATGRAEKGLVRAKSYIAVTANPLASKAAANILARGGSAVDAAVAVQMVLTLVEPQSSGIGGGAFILHWDAKTKELKTYDGRETAPASARPSRFLDKEGRPMPFRTVVGSGLSVGVPGLVRLLEFAHRRHGILPWRDLLRPAIELSENGFPVSPRLNKLLTWRSPESFGPAARAYFFDSVGATRPVGKLLKNHVLAKTLRRIAEHGAKIYYEGEIARAIVARLAEAPLASGGMTLADLAAYQIKERPPVCFAYRLHKICGMGPPSSGGHALAQTLQLLEPFDLGTTPLNADALHLIAEAEKLAYADRDRYVADPAFAAVPRAMLSADYLSDRRRLIDRQRAAPRQQPGSPQGLNKTEFGRDATIEGNGTSHISIIDAAGSAVSMTTTIESGFGARMMVAGFLLNNELTDFSFKPADENGRAIANRVEPGKRPRSSMSPTMVFDNEGEPVMILGSPGGSRIILYVVKSLIALIDWKLDARQAAALANFGSRNGPFEAEPGTLTQSSRRSLSAKGHTFRISPMTSGTHIIVRTAEGLAGAADPRREGMAAGEERYGSAVLNCKTCCTCVQNNPESGIPPTLTCVF